MPEVAAVSNCDESGSGESWAGETGTVAAEFGGDAGGACRERCTTIGIAVVPTNATLPTNPLIRSDFKLSFSGAEPELLISLGVIRFKGFFMAIYLAGRISCFARFIDLLGSILVPSA